MQSEELLSLRYHSDATMSTGSGKGADNRLDDGEVTWTLEDEQKVFRKLNCMVMDLILVIVGL